MSDEATAPADVPRDDATEEAPPKLTKPRRTTVIAMALVALVGVLLILWAWRLWPFTSTVVVTENAYVRGRVTSLAPQVNGYVTRVLFNDYDRVKAGQPLFVIDQRLYRQQLAQAEAALAQAQADYARADQTIAQNEASVEQARADLYGMEAERDRSQADAARVSELAGRGSVSLRERDSGVARARSGVANVYKARAQVRSAQEAVKASRVQRDGLAAAIESARAQIGTARVNLDNTIIRAPVAGQVSQASIRVGQYVAAGSQLTYLVPDVIWVDANFKETQLRGMAMGQPAWFTADALGDVRMRGHVERIAPATGSEFSVLRPDNASGNFTKVVQRVPVRIRIDAGQDAARRLRPGMSVIAHVDTAGGVLDRAR